MKKVEQIMRLSTRGEIVKLTNKLVLLLMTISIFLIFISLGGDYFPATGMTIAALSLANTLYMEKTGNTRVGGWVLVGILIYGQISVGYITGGFGGAIIYATPIIPVLAIFLVDLRAGWVAFAATSLILVALYFLQVNDRLPEYPLSESGVLIGRVLAIIFTSLISTWVTWKFASSAFKLNMLNKKRADTDHLTKLANRRAIDETIRREIARAQRVNSWFSIILADVDHFKSYNDLNGHQAGDNCLVEVSKIIQSCMGRATDLAGRYGGEEFIVLLPDTDPVGAVHIAENIRKRLAENQAAVCTELSDKVSLTFGVVSVRGKDIEHEEQLIKIADDALYEGKHNGRDCVVSKVIGEVPA